ncbi:MAG: thermitase [Gaiellaceae bacterium]|nr:thermitase [Gaiellaceae bacterium]
MRFLRPALAASAYLSICAVSPALASPAGNVGPTAHAEVSVGYSSLPALNSAFARYPVRIVRRVPALHVVQVRPAGDPAAFAATVSRLPGIRFVQRLAARRDRMEPALALPFGGPLPWEWQYSVTREDSVDPAILRAASAITIAVIDTGADVTAPDLASKNPTVYNQRSGGTDVRDTVGHGTFVAALAAGSGTNGDGIAGFGGDAHLLIIKAGLGDGSFTDLDEASAIVYAVDHGARIINLSLGGPSTTNTERRAIDYATSHGTLIVAAAGNEFQEGNPVEYPAALLQPLGSNGVGGRGLAVGASTTSGSRASFSNTGTYVSLVAPGENVFSAVAATSTTSRFPRVPLPGSLTGLYGYASGTSFAAPEVSGAAALVWAANPLLDAQAVAEVLKQSASSQGMWSPELGWGVLDVAAAVARATGIKPQTAGSLITLSAQVAKASGSLHSAFVVATLRSAAPGVDPASRRVQLETSNGVDWGQPAEATTLPGGQATWKLKLRKGTYRFRARWAGAGDLAGAVSATFILKVA